MGTEWGDRQSVQGSELGSLSFRICGPGQGLGLAAEDFGIQQVLSESAWSLGRARGPLLSV